MGELSSIRIDKLDDLPPITKASRIFRVPDPLRSVKKEAYEPYIVAIGPYHRGKSKQIKDMENHKLRYLKNLLQRTGEKDAKRYIDSLRNHEQRARNHYQDQEVCPESSEQFLEMMVLDGVFILELFRKKANKDQREQGEANELEEEEDVDPITKVQLTMYTITRDLLLLENQLPFFVLLELFSLSETTSGETTGIVDLILAFFGDKLPGKHLKHVETNDISTMKHLLHFIHHNWFPDHTDQPKVNKLLLRKKVRYIRSAKELEEAGIKFERADGERSTNKCLPFEKKKGKIDNLGLFDITFEHGTMKIPPFTVEFETETLFRNLIAYEQFSSGEKANYVIDYVTFLDCLIDSEKDAELLCQKGIIVKRLGEDKMMADLMNKLCDHAIPTNPRFFYGQIFENVNEHCDKPWNRHMAKLKHNYFNGPWALISFLAAALLLALTIGQFVYSVLAYY